RKAAATTGRSPDAVDNRNRYRSLVCSDCPEPQTLIAGSVFPGKESSTRPVEFLFSLRDQERLFISFFKACMRILQSSLFFSSLKKFILAFLAFFVFGSGAFAQKKNYQVLAIAFYNFENLFDTVDNPRKFDEEFTPNGPYQYNSAIYNQKLHNIASVL